MPEDSRIQIDRDGRLARITINRPPLNVIDIPTIVALGDAITTLAAEPEPDVIVIRGAGTRGFSAGVDIKDHTLDRVESMLTGFHAIFRALAAWDRVSIAAVSGLCLGGGFELATACDFLLCEEDARLGVPEIEVGCFPPVAVAAFPEQIGPKRAADWILTGRPVSVREAETAGLVSRVASKGGLDALVNDVTASLLAKSSSVLRVTVRALRADRTERFKSALDSAEQFYLNDLLRTADLQEGVASFMEKRKPDWTHR